MSAWLLVGPIMVDWDSGYKVMEQVATSVMFLMLFLLQRTQNEDIMALQLKLNELVAANPAASNRVLNADDISESELQRIRTHFRILDELSRGAGIDALDVAAAHRRHAGGAASARSAIIRRQGLKGAVRACRRRQREGSCRPQAPQNKRSRVTRHMGRFHTPQFCVTVVHRLRGPILFLVGGGRGACRGQRD